MRNTHLETLKSLTVKKLIKQLSIDDKTNLQLRNVQRYFVKLSEKNHGVIIIKIPCNLLINSKLAVNCENPEIIKLFISGLNKIFTENNLEQIFIEQNND